MVWPPLLATPAAQPGDPASVTDALVMFGTIAALLGIFFVVAVLLMMAHNRRQEQRKQRRSTRVTDPWREAGRRIRPDRGEGA
ncbi:MAG: hypothetical protein ACYSTY_04360 [Planctomycetota bacterium]|jgi:hypothetical protein